MSVQIHSPASSSRSYQRVFLLPDLFQIKSSYRCKRESLFIQTHEDLVNSFKTHCLLKAIFNEKCYLLKFGFTAK